MKNNNVTNISQIDGAYAEYFCIVMDDFKLEVGWLSVSLEECMDFNVHHTNECNGMDGQNRDANLFTDGRCFLDKI